MEHCEKKLSSQMIHRGNIINVRVDKVELENGSVASREVVEHSGGVGILAVDSQNRVLLVRQFRYGVGQSLLEIPAGKLNAGEDPAACGKRELTEETGFSAGSFEFLCKIHPTPAYVSEVIHIYLARDLRPGRQQLDPDEFLTVETMPLEEAVQRCLQGEITDAKTLAALLLYTQRDR